MRKESIKIFYPGAVISVNHYLGRRKDGGYYVKPETKQWKEEFQWLLKRLHLETWRLPLEVTCSGWFKNERDAPDLSNLSKIIMDSIEELINVNDKDFRWHDGTRNIGEKDPYLLITLKEGMGDLPKPITDTLQRDSSRVKKPTKEIIQTKRKTRRSIKAQA